MNAIRSESQVSSSVLLGHFHNQGITPLFQNPSRSFLIRNSVNNPGDMTEPCYTGVVQACVAGQVSRIKEFPMWTDDSQIEPSSVVFRREVDATCQEFK